MEQHISQVVAEVLPKTGRRELTSVSSPMQKLRYYGLSTEWSQKNPTFEAVCERYAPKNWEYISDHIEECYSAENPALVALNDLYGNRDAASAWMQLQVTGYALTRIKDSEAVSQAIRLFSANFSKTIGRFRILEIMLFFSRLSAGRYKTYGKFELKQIGEAWLEFLDERSTEMDNIAHRKALERAEEAYANIQDKMSIVEWDTYKPMMKAGYELGFCRAYSQWLRRWPYERFRASSREPDTDKDSNKVELEYGNRVYPFARR